MALPWVYVRRLIARDYGISPWEIDEWPANEVALELRLRQIAADATRR